METLEDILREMREFADTESQSIGRDVLRRRIQHFADRIEAARKREREATCQESLQVGNAAKMREALKAVYECAKDGVLTIRESAFEKVVSALAEPPRNCDLYETENETLKVFHATYPISTYYLYVKWLFAEAKGGAE